MQEDIGRGAVGVYCVTSLQERLEIFFPSQNIKKGGKEATPRHNQRFILGWRDGTLFDFSFII